jgi:hypothetical protein
MQLAMVGFAKSIRMAKAFVNQGQRFQNENPISRSQANASVQLFFLANVLI